jgi:hypothetical protein
MVKGRDISSSGSEMSVWVDVSVMGRDEGRVGNIPNGVGVCVGRRSSAQSAHRARAAPSERVSR